ncbi:unnamed protein product [Sphagnum balticum]
MKCTHDVLRSCGLSDAALVGWVMFAAPGQDILQGFNPVVVQKHHSGRASFDHRCPKMKMSLPYDHFDRRHLDMMQENVQLILSASFLFGIHVCPC